MSEEIKKDWERPWTTEEIVEHADNWNLACDAALLNTLKAFGDRILKRAEDVNDKIENLNENLSKIHLQVDLARNEFSSLRNTQFIECRVYEEDETLPPEKPEVEEENIVPVEETVEDFREVVALGLEILDEYYDKVNVTVSDSEGEDEEGPSYVYRRKDPYINRRLPLVIGSEEWHKKWHVGLEETDSENENSSEKLSDSESEDNFSQNKDHSDVDSEFSNLSGLNNPKVAVVPTGKTTQQELGTSESGSDVSVEPTPKSLSFAEQLAAKLGNVIREAEIPIVEPEVNKRPIQKQPSDFGALFSNEPPPFDDIKQKEAHGIFSGGKGLFDDEDEDDLWNPGKSVTSSAKQFSTSDKESNKLDQGKGLFDDDSDDGIFAPSKNYGITQKNTQPYVQSKKPTVPVFDEEPPLFVEETSSKEKKKPTGGVSLFGNSDLFHGQNIGKILKQRRASSSDDSNEDEPEIATGPEIKQSVLSSDNIAANESAPNKDLKKQTISPVPQRKNSQEKKKTLFDDDIFGDDLFSSTINNSSSGLFEKSVLFSDDDIVEPVQSEKREISANSLKSKSDTSGNLQKNDLLSPETPDTEYSFRKNSKSNISNLFEDTKNFDDDLFMSKDSAKSPKGDATVKKEFNEKSQHETMSTKPKRNLFGDDLEEDLFSALSGKKEGTKAKKSFLFDNDLDDDFNIFMAKSDNKNSGNVVKEGNIETGKASTKIEELSEKDQTYKSTKPKVRLFDDDLDNMDDFFSKISKESKKENSKSEKSSELLSEASSSNATILTNTEGTKDEKNNEIKKIKKDEVSEKVENLQEKPIAAPKSDVRSSSLKKPAIVQKPHFHIPASIEKPIAAQNTDDINCSLRNAEEAQESGIKFDQTENASPKEIKINPVENPRTMENSTEDLKIPDTQTENKIIKKEEEIHEVEDRKSRRYSKEDEYETVPTISVIEEPKDIEENVDIFASAEVDMEPPKIETSKYKNSPNVLNVNLMDSMPPPDDDWDTYSDNTFDDIEPGNDGFQSHPSSLFDSEPPSLFFDDMSAVPKVPTNESFDSGPWLSQKAPPDISIKNSFENDNRQAEDVMNIECDKNGNKDVVEKESSTTPKVDHNPNNLVGEDEQKKSNPQSETSNLIDNKSSLSEKSEDTQKNRLYNKPKLSPKPEVKTEKHNSANEDRIQTKPPTSKKNLGSTDKSEKSLLFDASGTSAFIEKNSDSLFGDDLCKDETDFLFSNTKQKHFDDDNKISENIISDKSRQKTVSFDDLDENQFRSDELGRTDTDGNMQSNILKITEKLQQISNNEERKKEKPVVPVPRKLSHNLNINVGALLPGSSLPKRDRLQSPDENETLSKSLPASRFNLNEDFSPTEPVPTFKVSTSDTPPERDYKLEKSVSFDGGTDIEVLQSITKDRAKIPVKRRPSSRRARQKSLRDSISDFRLDDAISDEATLSPGDEPSMSVKEVTQNNKSIVEANEQKTTVKDENSTIIPENVRNEIKVSEDDFENVFKTIGENVKNVNTANIISTKKKELFEDETEELFGESSTKLTKKMDSLFQDADSGPFEDMKKVSEEKYEPKEEIRSIPQDEPSDLPSSHSIKNSSKKIEDDFLQSIGNDLGSGNITSKKSNAEKKSKIDDLFESSDEDDIFKSTKISVKETENVQHLGQKDDLSISVIGKIIDKTDNIPSKLASKKSEQDNLFHFSDDEDFLENFSSGKNDGKTKNADSGKPKSNSLFDDMDDDIFGTSSSTKNKTKQDVKPSVINKKPPKSTSLRKLENIEGEEDPLSALLK